MWKPLAVSSECHWPELGHVMVLRPSPGPVNGVARTGLEQPGSAPWPGPLPFKVMDTPRGGGVLRDHSRDEGRAHPSECFFHKALALGSAG